MNAPAGLFKIIFSSLCSTLSAGTDIPEDNAPENGRSGQKIARRLRQGDCGSSFIDRDLLRMARSAFRPGSWSQVMPARVSSGEGMAVGSPRGWRSMS
jgi:hypothetical protein